MVQSHILGFNSEVAAGRSGNLADIGHTEGELHQPSPSSTEDSSAFFSGESQNQIAGS